MQWPWSHHGPCRSLIRHVFEVCCRPLFPSRPAPPRLITQILNAVFWELDELTSAAGLLKVETVGPVYMVASGLPLQRPDHTAALARLALAMRDALGRHVDPWGEALTVRSRHQAACTINFVS